MFNEIYKIQKILNDKLENDRIILETEDIENIIYSLEVIQDYTADTFYEFEELEKKLDELKQMYYNRVNFSFSEMNTRMPEYLRLRERMYNRKFKGE